MASNEIKWLVKAVEQHIVSKLIKAGFSLVPLAARFTKEREFRLAYPFGKMHRQKGESIEAVNIVFNKRGSPRFSIGFGVLPPEGTMTIFDEKMDQKELFVEDVDHFCTMPKGNWWASDFRVYTWPWHTKIQADFVKLAEKVAKLLPEIEEYFESGKIGRHVKHWDTTKTKEQMRKQVVANMKKNAEEKKSGR
jgi:hypothetical protein